jgi:hypothetical protein
LKDVVGLFAPVQYRKLREHSLGQQRQAPPSVPEQLGPGGLILPAQTLQAPLNMKRRSDPLYTHGKPLARRPQRFEHTTPTWSTRDHCAEFEKIRQFLEFGKNPCPAMKIGAALYVLGRRCANDEPVDVCRSWQSR